jgi:tetratricopeptide (TPR) repeat protein
MRYALSALVVVAVATLSRPLAACLWDYDTLEAEAKGIPDVIFVIVGRFERNPPLYYQMRLDRVARRLADNPDDLAAYDDAGVACDRLGRGDEAIAWMEKKAGRIDDLKARAEGWTPGTIRDHKYRCFANVGTFWVHRWARAGADRAKIDEVKKARDYIALAIALNPDAHFGRESYQLKALDWIIDPPGIRELNGLPGFLNFGEPANTSVDAVRGLTGLIALGNAWESVDVYNTLAQVLDRANARASVALLARLRCNELIDEGRRSLDPEAPKEAELLKREIARAGRTGESFGPKDNDSVVAAYRKLRAEADAWQKARTDYMMARLEKGRHPDTDASFWDEYREVAPPSIPRALAPLRSGRGWRRVAGEASIVVALTAVVAAVVVAVRGARRYRKGIAKLA